MFELQEHSVRRVARELLLHAKCDKALKCEQNVTRQSSFASLFRFVLGWFGLVGLGLLCFACVLGLLRFACVLGLVWFGLLVCVCVCVCVLACLIRA